MSKIEILSDRQHVIKRPAMYIGSVSKENYEVFIDGKLKTIGYVYGLVKIIEEVLDNSVDEAIRTNFKFANKIDVKLTNTEVTISDNGRGIPQDVVITPEGEETLGPIVAWTRTKAGSNFSNDEQRETGGMNGVGSALTNFFSSLFVGETCDGKNTVTVRCSNGAQFISHTVKSGGKQGTTVKFTPDFSHFGCTEIDENIIAVIRNKVSILSVVFPQIEFRFNNKKFNNSFKTYANMYGPSVVTEVANASICIATSEDGFRQLSYANGLHTPQGGTHIDYIVDGMADELMPMIKRKYKVDVTKARIKEFINAIVLVRNMKNMKFDSQTKVRITNTAGEIKAHLEDLDLKKLARSVLNKDEVIVPIIEAALMRKEAAEKAALTKAQRQANKAKVSKHIKANKSGKEYGTILHITEGDSAIGYLLSVRNQDFHGGYPLRGKGLNTWNKPETEILKNKEMFDLLGITGLRFNEEPFEYVDDKDWIKVVVNDKEFIVNEEDEVFCKTENKWVSAKTLKLDSAKKPKSDYHKHPFIRKTIKSELIDYSYIAIMVDADVDGLGSIYPNMLAFLSNWESMFKHERILFVKTPIIIANKGKDTQWFYNLSEYNACKDKLKGYNIRYIKGLGSLEVDEYERIIQEPVYDKVFLDENYKDLFEMLFGDDADLRKEWMKQ